MVNGIRCNMGAGASGLFKTGAKKGIEQVAKQVPKQFVECGRYAGVVPKSGSKRLKPMVS